MGWEFGEMKLEIYRPAFVGAEFSKPLSICSLIERIHVTTCCTYLDS